MVSTWTHSPDLHTHADPLPSSPAASPDSPTHLAPRPCSRRKAPPRHGPRRPRRLVHDVDRGNGPHRRPSSSLLPDLVTDEPTLSPQAVKAAAALLPPPPAEPDHPDEPDSAPHKQTKAQKAYNRRKELLDSALSSLSLSRSPDQADALTLSTHTEVNASTTPYSKSHARRLRRHAQPANNLVASLAEVEAVLPDVDADRGSVVDEDDDEAAQYEMGDETEGAKAKGKGKEKLTAKKRQRVLYVPPSLLLTPLLLFILSSLTLSYVFGHSTAESARLPAIIKNEQFAKSPFATIRQHTLNTLIAQKGAVAGAGASAAGKSKARAAR